MIQESATNSPAEKGHYVPKEEPIVKFAILCSVTLGIYMLIWYYRQFRRMKERRQLRTSPVLQSLTLVFWVYGLFKSLSAEAKERGIDSQQNPAFVSAGFMILSAMRCLPDPLWIIGLFSFVPVLPFVHITNELHKSERDAKAYFVLMSPLEWILGILGSAVTLLAVIGALISHLRI